MKRQKLSSERKYRFEFRHITILFVILIAFQLILSFVHKASLKTFLTNYSEKTEKDYVNQIATQTTSTLNFLIKNGKHLPPERQKEIVTAINLTMQPNKANPAFKEMCILIQSGESYTIIDQADVLVGFIQNPDTILPPPKIDHPRALKLINEKGKELLAKNEMFSLLERDKYLHILFPFNVENYVAGIIYFKMQPDFSAFTREIIASYDETTIIYLSIILLGLLAMYYIATYTAVERDEAQEALMEEHEQHLREQIIHEKESLFTKRIYHTHHKAEKVMGFIKEDIRSLTPANTEEIKSRVTRYSNFMSRVIYDMKWYDPPIHTIRSMIFNTQVNDIIRFIVDHIFLRISAINHQVAYQLDLDPAMPAVHINEYVIWEIIEPVIQNSIDHGGDSELLIRIQTRFIPSEKRGIITIEDNGLGISSDLLEKDNSGVKKIFHENVTTKNVEGQNSGYGCYIAWQLATQRCGWIMDAQNVESGGCRFTFEIPFS
ncbi:MAG: ATP-binding protein [Bacteroidetes bacterium]|nr:ATP-binding protein [Bacteroidota bacterium]